MGRRRKSDHHLPPRVYRTQSGSYQYYPPEGGSKKIAGKRASVGDIWQAYELARVSMDPSKLAYLWDEYHQSEQFARLAKVTQRDYEQCALKPLEAFRPTDCHKLKPQHIRKYMDKRGKASKHRANRELAWLSNVFAYAYERGLMPTNPCKGVKKFPEAARSIYVTDEMYLAMYAEAPTSVRVAMELAYCMGIRPTDVLSLRWSQVKPDGIHIRESKIRGQHYIKERTPRIDAALELAKSLKVGGFYVITTRSGAPYTRYGFNSAWSRARAKLPEGQRFQFRDLRSKAISDFEGEKREFSQHKTEAMVARYNRLPGKSPSH